LGLNLVETLFGGEFYFGKHSLIPPEISAMGESQVEKKENKNKDDDCRNFIVIVAGF
jgi:hypothetical protein